MGRRHGTCGMALLSVVLASVLGCGGSNPEQHKPSENLRQLAVLCTKHLREKGKMPASAADLKKFAGTDPSIKDVDAIFVSPRDNEPYVLILTAKMTVPGVGAKQVVAHEKTGSSGKKFVAYTTIEIDEIDDAKLSELLAKK